MAQGYHKRQRGSKWEFVFKKAGVLPKPLYIKFDTEEDGDRYAAKLLPLLERGIVPTEHQTTARMSILSDLIYRYLRDAPVKSKDRDILNTLLPAIGATSLYAINAHWVDSWISDMKRIEHLAPATIRAKVGALARCTDWGARKELLVMPDHPLRTLPDGYSQYTELDAKLSGGVAKADSERDRRLEQGEEGKVLDVIAAGGLARKQRPFTIPHQADLRAFFLLSLETAMRMREMYTLTVDQVDLAQRTVFLDKTKNGDKRQVPLSSVAMELMREQLKRREGAGGQVFPFWSGSLDLAQLKLDSNYLSKLFRSIFAEAGCNDLHFHDLRHEATSRLFERTKLSETEIMKITGHRSHKMMMRYANLRGSSLADKLW